MKNLKFYNAYLQDFEWLFLNKESELINQLYDFKLLDDYEMKNSDIRKIISYFLIKIIVDKISSSSEKCIFLIKPEILSSNCEILKHFNNSKVRREFISVFKLLIKNKMNVFVFLNKSYSNVDDIFNEECSEIKDYLDIHLLKYKKLIVNKNEVINSLFNKISKKIK